MSSNLVGRPMEILLVEDNMADACLTREALEEGNVRHRLSHVTDGEEALLFLRREKWFARAPQPDLILLDLNLPKLDGRELLTLIRKEPELTRIPVVTMTSSQDHEDEVRAQRMAVQVVCLFTHVFGVVVEAAVALIAADNLKQFFRLVVW